MYSLFQVFVPLVREITLHNILSLVIAQTTRGMKEFLDTTCTVLRLTDTFLPR